MTGAVVRLGVWSGPRNISTALMRAWENRSDCVVVDEPLYAHYLDGTGLDHPGRADVLASQPRDLATVVAELTGPVPAGVRVHYAKHMAHHLLPGDDTAWIHTQHTVMLVRDPAEVVASYLRSRATVTPDDLGLHAQVRLVEELEAGGARVPVVDAADFLRDPGTHLRQLCDWIGVPFSESMLTWPPGPRDSDGVWAPYWYDAVLASTGFEPYRPRDVHLDPAARAVAEACREPYEWLRERRLGQR